MDPERWAAVGRLYDAALAQPVERRTAFLAEACAGDEELRREVESLLAQDISAGGVLTGGAVGAAAGLVSDVGRSTLVGRRIGAYQILAPIGAGGMGEVYRARDTRLGREVAIKILPRAFTADADRLTRFEREARVLASLNHPHIAAIYGLEESGPRGRALVLELVEGETLAERISRTGSKGLPVTEALDIARQIAEALDAAHEKGIVHRDLKPANTKITPQGVVKVLDFGLAKLDVSGRDGTGGAFTEAPTITVDDTREGLIVGTAAYMSPEQARGQAVDKRTDIWAFGCVLYEMLAGRAPFRGDTVSDTLVAVLEREPDWSRLPAETPVGVRHLLSRCLEKNPKQRLRDIGDLRLDIDAAVAPPVVAVAPPRRIRAWIWVTAALAAALAGFIGGARLRAPSAERRLQFSLIMEHNNAYASIPRVSPDGSMVVYPATDSTGRRQLWLRRLDSDNASPIAGTDDALYPFWSPDGLWIGFYAQPKLKKVARDGGSLQTLATLPAFDGTAAWSGTGEIVYAPGNRTPLYSMSASGGASTRLTTLNESLGENSHRSLRFLPDGRHFLFSARCANRENNAMYSGSLDSNEIRRLAPIQSNVAYVPPVGGAGPMLLYVRDGELYRQPFDGQALSGQAERLMKVAYRAISMQGLFDVSIDGRVLITSLPSATTQHLAWFDRNGVSTGTLGPAGQFEQPRISPDGNRVIFNRPDENGGNRDVWMVEIDRAVAARLTTDPANEWSQTWSADGRRILFASDRNHHVVGSAWEKTSLDPGAGERPIDALPDWANPEDMSTDGRWIAFSNGAAHGDIWIAPTFGDMKPFRFIDTGFDDRDPHFSPDTKWIAYYSNETGRFEVYLRPFSGTPAASGRKIQVSLRGGFYPTWNRDGTELAYLGPDSKVYAASMKDFARSDSVPTPRSLFTACAGSAPTGSATQGSPYDVSPDGERFLFACSDAVDDRYIVNVNWQSPR